MGLSLTADAEASVAAPFTAKQSQLSGVVSLLIVRVEKPTTTPLRFLSLSTRNLAVL